MIVINSIFSYWDGHHLAIGFINYKRNDYKWLFYSISMEHKIDAEMVLLMMRGNIMLSRREGCTTCTIFTIPCILTKKIL